LPVSSRIAALAQRLFASRLARNAAALYSVQGLQYLIPLITLPWLVRALGTEGYGLMNVAAAFGGYLQVLCDYGFQLSASRAVAVRRDDRAYVSEQVAATLQAKLLLALAGAAAAAAVLALSPVHREHALLLALGAAGSLLASFFPSWLFQGMERMGGMAALSAGSRLSQLVLILLLVHRPEDLARALAIGVAVSFGGTVAAWILAWRRFGLRLAPAPFSRVRRVLGDGFEIFLSQAGTLLFANTNVMMLAAYASPKAVGLYAIAEKIVRVGIQVGGPLGTALYPRAALLLATSRREAFAFLRRVLAGGSLFFLALSLAIAVGADLAARLVCGHPAPEVRPLVWILSPLPLTVFADNVFGTQVLLNCGHRRAFMAVPLTAGALAIALQLLLIPRWGAAGACTSLLASELWILAAFALLARRKTGFPSLPSMGTSA
jgi:O-antigen/teichoic acid export membrane protein